jgi:hypothetical protein
MSIFLKMKHWQLFVLLIGIPVILQITMMVSIFASRTLWPIALMPAIGIIYLAIFLCWFWTLGNGLYKLLPAASTMKLYRFKIAVCIPVCYFIFLAIFIPLAIFSGIKGGGTNTMPAVFLFILPVHLISMACMFYLLYFNAKALKTVELQRPLEFSDFAGEFFMLWFFPIGLWILQPRINAIFASPELYGKNEAD